MIIEQKFEKYSIIEFISTLTFLSMSMSIIMNWAGFNELDSSFFWACLFFVFGLLQAISIAYREKMFVLRILMDWFCGTTLLWLAYLNISSIFVMPMIFLGVANIMSVIDMYDRIKLKE